MYTRQQTDTQQRDKNVLSAANTVLQKLHLLKEVPVKVRETEQKLFINLQKIRLFCCAYYIVRSVVPRL